MSEKTGMEEKLAILDDRVKDKGLPPDSLPSRLLTEKERREILNDLKTNHTPELDFEFIKVNNGLRKQENTIVMAPIGRGKSTLAKTLIHYASIADKKVAILISEDKVKQYLTMLNLPYDKYKDNILLVSEKEQLRQLAKSKHSFEDKIDSLGAYLLTVFKDANFTPDYIIFDNVHTSMFYNSSNSFDIFHFFDMFEMLCDRYKCSNIFFAHVATTSRDKVPLDPEDIKGFKDINVKAHHTAALYMTKGDRLAGIKPRLCFHWIKSRTQHQSTGTKFAFTFDESTSMYVADKEISDNAFNHFWKPKANKKPDASEAEMELSGILDEAKGVLTEIGKSKQEEMLKDVSNFL